MRSLVLALTLPVVCLSLQADTTGRIAGKVTDKSGAPVLAAKVNLKRSDINWSKDLTLDKNGKFLQVGLEPREFELTVKAEGYVEQKEFIKITMGDVLTKNIILLTPAEAHAEAVASGTAPANVTDPAAAMDAEGREAFNQAIPYFNESNFGAALPLIDKAYKNLSEVKDKLKDEKAKADLSIEVLKIERLLGICLAQAGAKKEDGEPFLLKALERNPKDERVITSLILTSKAKNDKASEDKYTAMLEALHGPNPDVSYNKGVEEFNAGKTKSAKTQLLKTLEIDPKYAEAHFLLAMVEFGENNLRGTKQNLLKYVELAPNGKNAAMAKEMLKDPSLKNIK